VRGLANLASGLILSLGVGVGQDLGSEENEHYGQGECQHPDPVRPRLVLASHLFFQTIPLTLEVSRSKHPPALQNLLRAFNYCTPG
jgi:hypothetical protein